MNSNRLQNAFFLSLVLLTTLAFFGLIQDFLLPIFWASVLATIFHPLYQWWNLRLGDRSNVASVLTIVLIVLLVLVPLLLTGFAVASEVAVLYDRMATGELNPEALLERVERTIPLASDLLARFDLDVENLRAEVSNATISASRYLATEAVAVGQNALRLAGLTFLMLYLLFFFLRDGESLLDTIVGAAPIGDFRERHLLNKFAEVSRATLKGTLVIGVVQGGIGGILFWALGIEGAVLWGVVMGLLSLLPAVGAAIVWIPAAALLLFTGQIAKGLLLLAGGTTLIGLADNILRPLLVGRDTEMPDYLILVTTLGGLTLFGLSGVVIGPVLGALFLAVWDMFVEEYARTARDETPPGASRAPQSSPHTPTS